MTSLVTLVASRSTCRANSRHSMQSVALMAGSLIRAVGQQNTHSQLTGAYGSTRSNVRLACNFALSWVVDVLWCRPWSTLLYLRAQVLPRFRDCALCSNASRRAHLPAKTCKASFKQKLSGVLGVDLRLLMQGYGTVVSVLRRELR